MMDRRALLVEVVVPYALSVALVVVLVNNSEQIGYARDEGFYFQAAKSYGEWLRVLVADPRQAFEREVIDRSFSVNHEHPSLMKLLFAISGQWFEGQGGWLGQPGTAHRFPAMLLAGVGLFVLIRQGMAQVSRMAGVVGGLLWIGMPRVFHHAHLACFDVPVAVFGLISIVTYAHALRVASLRASLLAGLCYGLMLDTKHNAWLLPALFLVHFMLTEGRASIHRPFRETWPRLRPLVCVLVIGPLVLWSLWPWLWHDTFERLAFWFRFHLHHEYYNMEYLGQTYHRPPMPRGYAWVMTLATVPLVTLVLALLGGFVSARHAWLVAAGERQRRDLVARQGSRGATARVVSLDQRRSTDLLWCLSLGLAYAPWLSPETPIFGGTKHWLLGYPFLCLFAARGFALLVAEQSFPSFVRTRPRLRRVAVLGAALVCVSGPLWLSLGATPYGLSTYTAVVGGTRGAATLGFNRTFWGYTTLALVPAMKAAAPKIARIYVHDTALQAFLMHQRDGVFPKGWRPTLNIADSDLALYHHEPHMKRVEYQIWEAYGTTSPAAVATTAGVPVAWLYVRPKR